MFVVQHSTAFATETVTATTNATGNIQLSQAVRSGTFITAYTVGTPSAMLIPFKAANGATIVKAVRWDVVGYTELVNTELTYTVVYKPA